MIMSSTTHASELFKALRPICLEIAREPTSCRIDALRDKMQSNDYDNSDFSVLVEYIIFPLQATVTRKNTSTELKIQAIGCMCELLSKTGLTRFDMFREIFQHVCFLLSSKEPGKVSANISEDSKDVLLDCILVLLDSSAHEVLECVYKDDFMPSLGHSISLLLNIALNEKAKHLAIKAAKAIKKFVYILTTEKHNNSNKFIVQEQLLSTKLASFLPGISISLSKVITGGINQGQAVIIAALEAWSAHMQVVMNNKFFPENKLAGDSVDELAQIMSKILPSKKHDSVNQGQQLNAEKCLEVKKDKEWFTNTGAKLKILIERISNLAGHSSWKVRLALVEFADILLKNCSMALEASVPCLIEIVIGLSSDEYVEVSQKSGIVISELNALLANNDQTSIIEIIEENLYSHFSSLPRLIRSTDEEAKLRSLNIIIGYLRLLCGSIDTTLNSGHLLKRMSQALIQILEFDLSDIRIVEQKTRQDISTCFLTEENVTSNCVNELNSCRFVYKKNFKHFRDDRILSAIVKICWYLGSHGNIVLLLDHLLDLFKSSVNRKQVVFLINEIVRGSVRNVNENVSSLVELSNERLNSARTCVSLILSVYLSKDIWNSIISNDESETLKSSIQKEDLFTLPTSRPLMSRRFVPFSEINSNVQLTCLLLEGIGVFATVLREHFESMLLEVLYPLMEKLGSRNATVSQVAHWSLSTIAECCKYNSMEELIASNVDYLINTISLNIRHINLNPDTPAVLNAMLQYGNKNLIPFLEDTLEEVLSLVDYSRDHFLLSLVKVLNSLAVAVCKWFPVETKEKRIPRETSVKLVKTADLRDYFLTQLKLKKESLGEVLEDDIDLSQNENDLTPEIFDEEKDEVKEVALQIKFTEKILEKCSYFLSSKFVTVRLVILDTILHGVLALSNTEDRLLPMVHKLWQPFVKCFSDDDLVVRTKAVSVLNTMVNTAGEFMRHRVVKDAFPALISYLVKQRVTSTKAGPVYNHTLGFKYQLAILNVIGALCHDLEIFDIECDKVLSATLPYLSQKQPLKLQQAALDAIRILSNLEPDLVWLSLNDLYCPIVPELPPPCSSYIYPRVHFVGLESDKNAEYAVNVQKLLEDKQS